MTRPLHTGSQLANNQGNLGLWYDKFCDQWPQDFSRLGGEHKQAWIRSMTRRPAGDRRLLKEYTERIVSLVFASGGKLLAVETDGPFVTGLGREHPIENGFAWHHLLGVPYLPGSSVKGLVRAWLRDWLDIDDAEISRLFGEAGCRGYVAFLDAVPLSPVLLKTEVLTPHYGNWPHSPDNPPGDWHSPKPIPFLAVEPGQRFQFALVPVGPVDRDVCDKVCDWLKQALECIGAGAKTGVGFGRFVVDVNRQRQFESMQQKAEQAEEKRQIQVATQGLSPLARDLVKAIHEGGWEENKDAFSLPGVIEGWLERLEESRDPDALNRLYELMRKHYGKVLSDPDKMKKGKYVHKERQRNFAKRINALANDAGVVIKK